MKLYNKLGWAVLPFALLAASCQNDDFMEAGHEAAEGVMTLHATMAPQTRAQIALGTEDESREIFMWNEGDSFTLYDKTNPTTTSAAFTISGYSEEAPATEATFVGEGNFANNSSVIAIYPAQEGNVTESAATLTLPTATITTDSAEEWKEYMRQSMYMYADATLNGNNTQLAFQHLCALIRVSYTNATSEDKTITNVTVTGEENYFGSIAKFEFANNALTSTQTSSTCEFNFSGLTVASGRTTDFYFFFFPGDDASNGTLTVSINDKELEMSLSDLTSFSGFEVGKRYWFNTVEMADGLLWKKDVSEAVITNLPLIQLAEEQNNVSFNKETDGSVNVLLNQEQISQVTVLEPSNSSIELDNLDGLEYFINLETLSVNNMGLTTLDVSMLTNLSYLDCRRNPLSELNIENNAKLQTLMCSDTELTVLDVTHNSGLYTLVCSNNQISNLDLTNNPSLMTLEMLNNPISSIDISHVLNLISLNLDDCTQIAELDVSKHTQLKKLSCQRTSISVLDVNNNTELVELLCDEAPITTLNVSNCTKLETLWCGTTQIEELDVTKNTALVELSCQGFQGTEIDLSYNAALTTLILANSNSINKLDVTNNPLLEVMKCIGLSITELDVSKNTKLKVLECNSAISKLDLSNNPVLEELICYSCHLNELDITKNPNLTKLFCGHQQDINYEDIVMTLYLTAEQKEKLWTGNMEWETTNERVNPVVK